MPIQPLHVMPTSTTLFIQNNCYNGQIVYKWKMAISLTSGLNTQLSKNVLMEIFYGWWHHVTIHSHILSNKHIFITKLIPVTESWCCKFQSKLKETNIGFHLGDVHKMSAWMNGLKLTLNGIYVQSNRSCLP